MSEPTTRPPAITGIRPLPSRPSVRSIRVDGRVVGHLPEAAIESLGLAVGQAWTERLADAVREAEAISRARRDALRLLGRRDFSRADLVRRLEALRHVPSIAGAVANELARDRWIDDEAFARSIIEQALRRPGASPRMVLEKLRRRGIEAELADQVIREAFADASPTDSALALARGRLAELRGLAPDRAARRIAQGLARRGFEPDVVEEVIQRLGLDEPIA